MKAWRCVSLLVLVCGFIEVASGVASAAPGDLDRFFGREGVAKLEDLSGGGYVTPLDMAVGPGDEIYVLRRRQVCGGSICASGLAVTRHDPHGARDTSYGYGGVTSLFVSLDFGMIGYYGSLAIAPDGKIVVASTDQGDLVLARLNPDGRLDESFGKGGEARVPLGTAVDQAQVAVQGDGRIVVGSESAAGYGEASVIVGRYTPQGLPDPTFSGGAPLVTNLGAGLGGLALTGGSGIVIAGPRCCALSDRPVHVGRLNSSGVFDRRFGNRGHRFLDDVAHAVEVGAVAILPSGKIVVAGSGSGGDAFTLRLLPGGRLDRAFGSRGIAYMKDARLSVVGIAADGRGRLVVGGTSPIGNYSEDTKLTLLRRRANGGPDRTFGGGGPARLRATDDTRAKALGLQSDGRIVALVEVGDCERSCAPPKSMLARYLGGSSGSRCLGRKATIVGTRAGEKLTGTPRRDVIAALSGNDLVRGRGGNDLVCGGRGNDTLVGGQGKDRLNGGAGRDQIRQQ